MFQISAFLHNFTHRDQICALWYYQKIDKNFSEYISIDQSFLPYGTYVGVCGLNYRFLVTTLEGWL